MTVALVYRIPHGGTFILEDGRLSAFVTALEVIAVKLDTLLGVVTVPGDTKPCLAVLFEQQDTASLILDLLKSSRVVHIDIARGHRIAGQPTFIKDEQRGFALCWRRVAVAMRGH